jgi:hypothetical protein
MSPFQMCFIDVFLMNESYGLKIQGELAWSL